jgi:hypothetical protein
MFFTFDYHNFKRDLSLILAVGVVSYVNDIYHSRELYAKCLNNIPLQTSHLFHHMFFAFQHLAWISNNKTLLQLNIVSILLAFAHWYKNKNKCGWTQQYQAACGVKRGLNSILSFRTGDPGRKKQIFIYIVISVIAVLKLLYLK